MVPFKTQVIKVWYSKAQFLGLPDRILGKKWLNQKRSYHGDYI